MKSDAAFAQSLGARIRARRQALRMTQLGLALALGEGVSRATVCAWELGTRPVSAFDWARIDAAFDQRSKNRHIDVSRCPGRPAAKEAARRGSE